MAGCAMSGIPSAPMDIADTAELVAVPETPDRAYTDAHIREALWLRSCEAADDTWTDEPTIAG